MPVRALLFDVGDTLWHAPAPPPPAVFRQLAADRAREALTRLALDADAAFVARLAWDTHEAAMAAARQSVDLQEPPYAELVATALAADRIHLGPGDVEALLEAIYVSGVESGKVPFPDARPALIELKSRGFRLATVTNRAFGGSRYRCDLQACGLDIGWEAHAVSVEVGFLKPHRAPFTAALDALALVPAEAIMVGNSLREDIAGAQAIGIRSAWRRCVPDAVGVVPDWTFDTLDELLDIPELRQAP